MTSGQGLEPEQVWEDPSLGATNPPVNPTTDSIGFVKGEPAGSASPLTWAQSQYARLALALSAGRNLETPDIVTDRYVRRGMPAALPLTITSPAENASVDSSTVPVTGTTSPHVVVVAEAVGGAGGAAAIASTTADSAGNWSLCVPTGFGGTTITVTATLHRRTGYGQINVTNVNTFGSNFGAQLLDIYVRNPAQSATSTSAA
jgi:glucoamylase